MFLFAEDELCDPVAHAVTDRLYNDDKICKGRPVKKKKKKPSNKATRGKRKSKKNFLSSKLTWQIKKM